MKMTSILILSFLFIGKPNIPNKDQFVGKWLWVKSEMVDRSGKTITNPSTDNRTEMVEITPDFRIKIIQDGKIVCDEEFDFSKLTSKDIYNPTASNCSLSTLQISNDTLQSYTYLGCPSITDYYVRVKA